ncbi:DUF4837 family protein [Snuella sedimenti]|uniref:DUF4837 family protein n=1 Tax=Snuella sedimenti TaxID=2798802 RepID=A0A8J7IPD3_9FLAO|nr:DUF4837 family protein [Snuella sedimenti]MBJ6368472.1 DUF4837 family protein [Snuella sedimenti]
MRNIFIAILGLLLVISCLDSNSKSQKTLLDSSSNINQVSVVIDNEMWGGSVGEAIRKVLTTTIYGLPQDEPTFVISQIPPSVFSGFVTRNRTLLKIELGKVAGLKIVKDVYAKPQKVIVVSGPTKEALIEVIDTNSDKILEEFKKEELKELQRRIAKALHKNKAMKEKMGVNLKFPSVFRIAKEEGNFFWIRKDITTGSTNLLVYELPYNAIKRNDSIINQIIKIRDSIGQKHIPGPDPKKNYMVTENAYTPFHAEIILDNKPTLETKGLWDMKGGFMAGPYVNYAIEDKKNNRWVVVEGFVFAPSVDKRNYMFELDAIIKSVKID